MSNMTACPGVQWRVRDHVCRCEVLKCDKCAWEYVQHRLSECTWMREDRQTLEDAG